MPTDKIRVGDVLFPLLFPSVVVSTTISLSPVTMNCCVVAATFLGFDTARLIMYSVRGSKMDAGNVI